MNALFLHQSESDLIGDENDTSPSFDFIELFACKLRAG